MNDGDPDVSLEAATEADWRAMLLRTLAWGTEAGANPDAMADAMISVGLMVKEGLHGTVPTARALTGVARGMLEMAAPDEAGGQPTTH